MNRDRSRRSAFGAKVDRDRKLEQALKHELRAAGTPDRDACVDAETLGAWADGGLDAVQMAAVELHVASCARCQAIVGVTVRSAPIAAVTEAPAGFSLWKWWLAPIAAGAAAVTLWMVVPQETMPAPPAQVTEAKKDAPPESQAKGSEPAREAAPPVTSGRDNSQGRREVPFERKQQNRTADQSAVGAVAAAPPAPAATVAEPTLQKSLRLPAAIEIVSPDSRWRWRVNAGAIERSEDGGASWLQAFAAPGDTITAGTSPAGSICWLIGANGVVFVTTDGATFARVPIPERVAVTAITATDARSAIVTTADGRRFRTDDSGRNWRQN